jgi:8-amino-7-oxononanoate synthase
MATCILLPITNSINLTISQCFKDMHDEFLSKRLDERKEQQLLRSLRLPTQGIVDFCSNDYLGIVTNDRISAAERINSDRRCRSGATGSRLLSGNYPLLEEAEEKIASFHQAEAGLIYNSGYDANLGLLSCVPQRNDVVIFDSLSHASIRDGIRLSRAASYSFQHNDMNDLEKKLQLAVSQKFNNRFVVTESLFSMDGDLAPLREMVNLCKSYDAHVVVDEAHATGVIGDNGEGLVQEYQLQDEIFARIHTFGKAVGTHGAVVLGSKQLKSYLINFSRALIYTTALPEIAIHHLLLSYAIFPSMNEERKRLRELAALFQRLPIHYEKLKSNTAIQGVIIPGNERARTLAEKLQARNFDIRPILYPTVPKGMERFRIVLHSFNTEDEIVDLAAALAD